MLGVDDDEEKRRKTRTWRSGIGERDGDAFHIRPLKLWTTQKGRHDGLISFTGWHGMA